MSDEEFYLYDIIDLISERHIQLRREVQVETSLLMPEIQLSNIEWYIIDKIAYDRISLVNLSENIHKSRQAIHKTVKQLDSKNILKIVESPENKKEKCVILTEFGVQCYEIYIESKKTIKAHLKKVIGHNDMNNLKNILICNWEL